MVLTDDWTHGIEWGASVKKYDAGIKAAEARRQKHRGEFIGFVAQSVLIILGLPLLIGLLFYFVLFWTPGRE